MMTKEKWQDIHEEELEKLEYKLGDVCYDTITAAPEHWVGIKKAFREYIEGMDKATQVYNEENKE